MDSTRRNPKRRNPLFTVAILIGVGLAVYVYLFSFDEFSETELIELTPFWLLPIVFGLYGFTAEAVLNMLDRGEATTVAAAALIFSNAIPLIGIVLLSPLLLIRGSSAVSIAAGATLVWTALLVAFFALVFPLL
jgi:hypothetical protein